MCSSLGRLEQSVASILEYAEPLSTFAFNFNLRRYTMGTGCPPVRVRAEGHGSIAGGRVEISGRGLHFSPQPEPFLSLKPTETTQRFPQKVLT